MTRRNGCTTCGTATNAGGDLVAVVPADLTVIIRVNALGGSERHTVDLVNGLAARGRRIAVVQSGGDLRSAGLRADERRLRVISLAAPMRDVPPRIDLPKDVSRAEARAWKRAFDQAPARRALVIKPWYFACSLRFMKAVRRSYGAVMQIEHSLPPEIGPRTSRWYAGVIPGLGLWWHRQRWWRRRMARLSGRSIAVSEQARRLLIDECFLDPASVTTCRNGVDVSHWQRDQSAGAACRSELGIPSAAHVFGTVGRLVELKCIDLALRAFARVPVTDTGPFLCVAGDGPCRPALESLASQLGVGERVRFLGFRTDVRPVLSAVDTLLLPSTTESFPLALLEALACGCHILASDVGAVAEIVTAPALGDVLDNRHPDAWAACMARDVAAPRADRAESVRRRHAYVTEHFSQEEQLTALEQVLFAQESLPGAVHS